jgi:hypothetical protein
MAEKMVFKMTRKKMVFKKRFRKDAKLFSIPFKRGRENVPPPCYNCSNLQFDYADPDGYNVMAWCAVDMSSSCSKSIISSSCSKNIMVGRPKKEEDCPAFC